MRTGARNSEPVFFDKSFGEKTGFLLIPSEKNETDQLEYIDQDSVVQEAVAHQQNNMFDYKFVGFLLLHANEMMNLC